MPPGTVGTPAGPATGPNTTGPLVNPAGSDPALTPNANGGGGLDPVTGRANAAINPTPGQPFNAIDPATGRALGTNTAIDPATGRPFVNRTGIDPVSGRPLDGGIAIDPATGLPNRLGTDPNSGAAIRANPSLDPATGRALRSDPNLLPSSTGSIGNITVRTFGNASNQLVPFNGGLRIGALDQASFAGLSGIRVGDTIRAVNSGWVRTPNDLAAQLNAAAQADQRAWVLIDRDGRASWMRLSFTGQPQPMLGVQATDQGGLVQIHSIEPNSLAYRVGLQAGDEIVNINGRQLGSNADLVSQLEAAAQGNGEVVLHVRRNGVLYEARTAFPRAEGNASARTNSRVGL